MKITSSQKKLLETKGVALATTNLDDSPNVIAIGFAKVVADDLIVITDNFMKQTPVNLKNDHRICLAVWSDDWEEGYKFVGTADYETQGKWAQFVKEMKENKDMPAKAAMVMKVRKVIKLG